MSASNTRTFGDFNKNGIPDRMEKHHGLSDLNGNGIDDKHERKSSLFNKDRNGNGIPDKYERSSHSSDMNRNGIPDSMERGRRSNDLNGNGIPDQMEGGRAHRSTGLTDLNGNGVPDQFEKMHLGTAYRSEVLLPTKVIEKPAAIHEEIRREQVEEIQPIVNVEKLKTEVHQVTQPLIDREVRAVGIQERVLPTEILPQVTQPTVAVRSAEDFSTIQYRDTTNMVVEKPAVYMETQKKQIIEEIQPVIYKETIVPTLIKETKPIYQTIVEGTVFTHTVLPAQQLSGSQWSSRTWTSGSDLNGNGIPDQLEGGNRLSSDFNGNGIPDSLERGGNLRSNDLNRNGIPDQFEGGRRSNDLNGNGVPDSLERKNAPYQAPNSSFSQLRTM